MLRIGPTAMRREDVWWDPKTCCADCVLVVFLQAPALAHLMTGDTLPETFLQGFLWGLEHPVFELDHLGAVLGIGILSGLAARGIVPLLAFSVAAVLGVVLTYTSADIPAGELLVGLTTVMIGVLVATRQSIRPTVGAALFAVAGLIHGASLGDPIEGAKSVPLMAYLIGLLTTQIAVGTAACIVVIEVANWRARRASLTVVGILVVLVGGIATVAAMPN
jgi:urease accessory protein